MTASFYFLEHCLAYVDLNMVRCGAVKHPRDWDGRGYGEVMGSKRRNRVLDVPKLLELMEGSNSTRSGNIMKD